MGQTAGSFDSQSAEASKPQFKSMKSKINPFKPAAILLACINLCCPGVQATILTHPSITGGSNAFGEAGYNDGPYKADNVFDRDIADYASSGAGADTYLEFTFPGAVTFDSMIVVNRNSSAPGDWIANYTLTVDSGTRSITRTAFQGQGGFDSFAPVTATTIRLDVDTLGGGGAFNAGAMEIYFLNTPAGMSLINGVSVTAASNSLFGSGYVATNAINGKIGRDNNTEFASDAGTDTFVDFSFGMVKTVTGFDFFDRAAVGAQVSSFDLIFSADDVWGNEDDITRNYTGSTQSDNFSGISAKNVRYDVTGTAGSNVGINEIRFYEPLLTWKGTTDGTWDIGSTTNWNDGTGAVAFTDGSAVIFDDSASITTVNNAVAVAPDSITVSNPTKNYTIGGSAISGGTGIAKSGAGDLTLTGVNTYTGGTTIDGGVLEIGGTGNLGSGSYSGGIENNAALLYSSSAAQTISSSFTGTGTLEKTGGAILTLEGKNTTYSGVTTVNGGTLLFKNNNCTLNTAIIANHSAVEFYGGIGGTAVIAKLTGGGNWTVDGPGGGDIWTNRVILHGTGSDNTGSISVINAGKLWSELGAGRNPIGDTSDLSLATNAVFSIYGPFAAKETIGGLNGSGTVDFADGGGGKELTLELGGGGKNGSFSGSILNSGSSSGPTVLSISKTGSGTQSLSGTNSYTGATTVNEGTLSLGNGTTNTSLADTAAVVIGTDPTAVLHLNYIGTDVVGSLTINGVPKAPGSIVSASDLSGRITGSGTLTVGMVNPYTTWANSFLPGNDVSNPAGDNDNDGLTNQQEFAFGLSPISGSSVNPIIVPLNKTTGQFSYQRLAASGLTYTIWTSTTLAAGSWIKDVDATNNQAAGPTDGNGNQTVVVTLTGIKPLSDPKLFVRVAAD
jgi:autotransporter-associated beta strand protein